MGWCDVRQLWWNIGCRIVHINILLIPTSSVVLVLMSMHRWLLSWLYLVLLAYNISLLRLIILIVIDIILRWIFIEHSLLWAMISFYRYLFLFRWWILPCLRILFWWGVLVISVLPLLRRRSYASFLFNYFYVFLLLEWNWFFIVGVTTIFSLHSHVVFKFVLGVFICIINVLMLRNGLFLWICLQDVLTVSYVAIFCWVHTTLWRLLFRTYLWFSFSKTGSNDLLVGVFRIGFVFFVSFY